MEFKDKRVLVTGSSRGIGFAAAQRFLEGGARVVINGRSEAGVKAAAEALGQRDRVFGIGADIAAVAGCEYLVSETIAILGGIDVLVVSAGVATLAPIEETTEAVFDSMLDTNLKGLFFTSRAAIPALRESKGCITYVASDSGVRGEAYLVSILCFEGSRDQSGKITCPGACTGCAGELCQPGLCRHRHDKTRCDRAG